MDEDDEIAVTVRQSDNSNDIYVLIPPKYWNLEGLSEFIKAAVDTVIEQQDEGHSSNETH